MSLQTADKVRGHRCARCYVDVWAGIISDGAAASALRRMAAGMDGAAIDPSV